MYRNPVQWSQSLKSGNVVGGTGEDAPGRKHLWADKKQPFPIGTADCLVPCRAENGLGPSDCTRNGTDAT